MDKSLRIVIIVFTIVIVSFVSLCFFAYHIVTTSLPKTKGEMDISDINEKVDIYRDKYNIPHISAKNEHDLYFTQGFITSQDRFWQMDIIKRAAQGKLSEIFGASTIKYDKIICTLGIQRRTKKIVSNLNPNSGKVLQAYVDGINYFIKENSLPIEFKFLSYKPDIWTIEDCISIIELWKWQMNQKWKTDVFRELLTYNIGQTNVGKYFNDTSRKKLFTKSKFFQFLKPFLMESLPASFPRLGYDCSFFILSGNKSSSNIPLVSVIVNTNPVIPCLFYEIQLSSNSTNMYGFSIPGIPGVLIGYNQYIVWGVTSLMSNEIQFRPITDLLNTNSIITFNEKLDIGPDSSLMVTYYEMNNRPLIPVKKKEKSNLREYIMVDWPGFEPHDTWNTLYKLGKARDWEDFCKAIKTEKLASLNFFYADKKNNIGSYTCLQTPFRKIRDVHGKFKRKKYLFYLNKDTSSNDLSKSYNPAKGYIISDNLPFTFGKNVLIDSTLGSATRIKQLLEQKDSLSIQVLKQIQADEYSLFAVNLKEKIISLINPHDFKYKAETDILEQLALWQGNMKAGSAEAAFFQIFIYNLFQKSVKNEIGDSLFNSILSCKPLYYEGVKSIIDNFMSDDTKITTRGKNLVIDSFKEAVSYLQDNLGEDISQWSWGALHTLQFQNPMGVNPFLNETYNPGPLPAGGSYNTINKYSSDLYKLFSIQSSPAAKMIIDLQGHYSSFSILSTGQSGQVFDDHYRDQIELSLHNLYHSNMTDTARLADIGWDHFILW